MITHKSLVLDILVLKCSLQFYRGVRSPYSANCPHLLSLCWGKYLSALYCTTEQKLFPCFRKCIQMDNQTSSQYSTCDRFNFLKQLKPLDFPLLWVHLNQFFPPYRFAGWQSCPHIDPKIINSVLLIFWGRFTQQLPTPITHNFSIFSEGIVP